MGRVILHLRAATHELYGVLPGDFTRRRAALVAEAKAAGQPDLATQVGALRKPTLAAWAINHLVRVDPEALDPLREFAVLMRHAQSSLDGEQLRLLGRERSRRVDEATEAVVRAATETGQRLGAAPVAEIQDTLVALIADEAAERSVLTGAMLRPLSYSGFGEVDLDEAIAAEGLTGFGDDGGGDDGADDVDAGPVEPPIDLGERRAAARAARRATVLARLTRDLETARTREADAQRHTDVVSARLVEVTEGVADLERRLATARDRLVAATAEREAAKAAHEAARDRVADAERALADHEADAAAEDARGPVTRD